jgi:transposase
MKSRRNFTREFKLSILQELEGRPASVVCKEHELTYTLVNRWKREYQQNPQQAFNGNGNLWKENAKVAQYERLIGRLYAEIDLLKKTLITSQQRRAEENRRRFQ